MAAKRERVTPNPGDTRLLRRDKLGRFTSSQADLGRSLSADKRQKAERTVGAGQGDKGDQRKR